MKLMKMIACPQFGKVDGVSVCRKILIFFSTSGHQGLRQIQRDGEVYGVQLGYGAAVGLAKRTGAFCRCIVRIMSSTCQTLEHGAVVNVGAWNRCSGTFLPIFVADLFSIKNHFFAF